ncbi:hypothetical protein C8R41DRAFT_629026 [Lentinula lateritia]|uniref:Uncharacterized protein n=1 Tax=Lentinula lateritia TaxID=40482 RepID=A0ABQ8V5Y7_9AGAR|nr:hypothetical protein C8R41DRAFT_629026 [Lentinula lateritia]
MSSFTWYTGIRLGIKDVPQQHSKTSPMISGPPVNDFMTHCTLTHTPNTHPRPYSPHRPSNSAPPHPTPGNHSLSQSKFPHRDFFESTYSRVIVNHSYNVKFSLLLIRDLGNIMRVAACASFPGAHEMIRACKRRAMDVRKKHRT